MFIHNADIASVLSEIADLLEIQDANQFRVRAYRGAARTIGGWATNVQTLLDQPHALTDLPGIGADLAFKIGQIVATGTCGVREQLPEARSGRISRMRGFGRKTEQRITNALQARRSKARRFLLADAERMAAPLLAHLRASANGQRVEVADSLPQLPRTRAPHPL